VFVLTHHPREPLQMRGGITFYFVSDGIESALKQAKDAARGRDVSLPGGASAVNQYLAAGLVDEIDISIAPLILGTGERLFAGLDHGDAQAQAGPRSGRARRDPHPVRSRLTSASRERPRVALRTSRAARFGLATIGGGQRYSVSRSTVTRKLTRGCRANGAGSSL
jgi:RibD C-terminal domain